MSYIYLSPNTTFCEDTPENWREFYELKAKLTGQKPPGEPDKPEMRLSRRRNTARRCYHFRGSNK